MFDSMNPSKLAGTQDMTIAIDFKDRSQYFISEHIKYLERFNFLLSVGDLTGTLPKNNLQIRQWLILGALYSLQGKKDLAEKNYIWAFELFRRNTFVCAIYSEGFSYYLYVKSAFDFFFLNVELPLRFDMYKKFISAQDFNFKRLASPDGSVPTTDTRAENNVAPLAGSYLNLFGCYSVYRLNGSYLFISHNPEIIRLRKNRHVAPDFGHFVFWKNGQWIVPHPWYKGYADKQARQGQERDYLNVPKGNWNGALWRFFSEPKLKVIEATYKLVELEFAPKCRRTFVIGPNDFSVHDNINGAVTSKIYGF